MGWFKKTKFGISKKDLSKNAITVLSKLNKEGFEAYLVGGGVRDILAGLEPKDFDVATNATPEQVRKVFSSNSRIIGRRFKIVHVYFHRDVIEVSTFRAGKPEYKESSDLEHQVIASDNEYGTIDEDVYRRDFTVNALYYSLPKDSVEDFVGGLKDIKQKKITMIGDTVKRAHEDPVRLLRAIRLSAKLQFSIDKPLKSALKQYHDLLGHVPESRLFDEMNKMFYTGYARESFEQLRKYGYFNCFFPETESLIADDGDALALLELAMERTDDRYWEGKSLNPGFLLSVMGWPVLQSLLDHSKKKTRKWFSAMHNALHDALKIQCQAIAIPKRFQAMMQSVWLLQYHMQFQRKKRAFHVIEHRYFRAAIDFLEMRAQLGEPVERAAKWWRQFERSNQQKRAEMVNAL